MKSREELAAEKFKCSTKERALFEAGIKMGTIYHQFVGMPLNEDSIESLEDAIERGVLVQPYVESVKVRIDRSIFGPKKDEYSYRSLTGEMLDVVLVIKIDNVRVKAEMRYDPKLNYPLMYISDVE
ncbi:dihydroneopterin aldolase [Candidatus Methanoplasma termitum]|uniref:Dihydroneopterin aldolase n=1 Tax=Candidatus Methanoplasma termitum TaxID=1577791 RepID=A0A0A7LE62_9ARCH|nr:dihydroneopterin aldolase family protein [Candidatus Methanoplasma termitum]AIZ56577.1 dihydroneopterin aldolase [Candidatus Methanoplasma termitum]MCL2333824.1 dihydroneopterin aldolase family protein [Candidatus Methanoplasma sp.]